MFEFRIIMCENGAEIVDTDLKTPYSALTPSQMLKYQNAAMRMKEEGLKTRRGFLKEFFARLFS